MLSQAHPITNLFETLENDPINYLQVVQDLMVSTPSVPPEQMVLDPIPEVESIMELDLQKINEDTLQTYKSAFYDMSKLVTKRKMCVAFPGLDYLKQKYTRKQCCSWYSQHKSSPKREMVQLLSAIEAQSRPTERQWIIEVTNG